MNNTKQFINDRNEAFASLDKNKIIEYCKKYNIDIPENEEIFWAGVHKVVCNLYFSENTIITLDRYNNSYNWLKEHGYSPFIN